MEGLQRRNIDLPEQVINQLKQLADNDNRKIKPYMEIVLTKHSKKKSEKQVWDYLCKAIKLAGVNDNNLTARKIFDYIQ